MASIYHSKSLNINNCFEEELLSLKGIGKCIAKRIIKQRAVCAFSTAEDFIERVKGIGQTSWRRVALQNEVNIVFGAQAVRSVERITGKMNQRRRGRLILPQDPTFYRKGQWVVIDSQYRALYPRTLWGVIESDGINENGILTVRTGRIQLQNINWKHCVVEQFRRKEVVQLINAEQYKEHMGDDQCMFLSFVFTQFELNRHQHVILFCLFIQKLLTSMLYDTRMAIPIRCVWYPSTLRISNPSRLITIPPIPTDCNEIHL